MIKITDGSAGWWFDDHHFYSLDRSPLDYESESAEDLRRLLCARTFNLPRWAGEEGRFGPVSVGFHSLLVSHLAGRLAEARDLSSDCVRLAKSYGAAHDLGERLGLGDIVSPILRKHPEIKALNVRHQHAVEDLFTPWLPTPTADNYEMRIAAAQVVHDADHLAAAIERRHLFDDDSGDCEAPGVDAMMEEVGMLSASVLRPSDSAFSFLIVDGLFVCGLGDRHVNLSRLETAIRCAR